MIALYAFDDGRQFFKLSGVVGESTAIAEVAAPLELFEWVEHLQARPAKIAIVR